MFARLVVDLRKLGTDERQELFSNLLRGRVTWEQLVAEYDGKEEKERAESLQRLARPITVQAFLDDKEPQSPLLEPSSPLEPVEIKDAGMPSFRAEVEVNKFFEFDLSQRIALARDAEYSAKLFKLVRSGGRNEQRLRQQIAKDATFQRAAQLVVAFYAELIYDEHADLTTDKQIKAIQSLVTRSSEDEFKSNTAGHRGLMVGEVQTYPSFPESIQLGQEFCRTLLHSLSGTPDVADYFRSCLENAVTYQAEFVAPFNKTTRFLREYKGDITQPKWDTAAWGVNFRRCPFWAVTPDGVKRTRHLFDDKTGLSGAKMDPYEDKTFDPAKVQDTLASSMRILEEKENADCLRVPAVTQLYKEYRPKGDRAFTEEVALQAPAIAKRAGR